MKHPLPPAPQFMAFTLRANGGILNRITTQIGVSLPSRQPLPNPSESVNVEFVSGVWDTGATNTCITPELAHRLGLTPTGRSISLHAGGSQEVDHYFVDLYLPNRVIISGVTVHTFKGAESIEALVGMDIIGAGDFAISNVAGNTVVSYRFPSIKEVDFVQEVERIKSMGKPDAPIGRNDLCPCGSGKKYKNCHMPR